MAEETKLKLDLDPKKIIQAMKDTGEETKTLAKIMEESLGKSAPKSIDEMEKAAEKGSSNISTYFRNLGKRLKEDMKTAFDIGGLVGGLKIGKEIADGVKSVFDMERAFDRLNTRLQLTGKTFDSFKKSVGEKVSMTGQKLEDIFPGLEVAAAKGGIRGPAELAGVAESLAKVRSATGENVEGLADSVVEILKTEGKRVNAQTFKDTLDAIQATRTTGSFKTAGEAAGMIEQISPYARQFGLGTREMGGMAATASRAGLAGGDILRQLLAAGSQIGGGQQLNAMLGQDIFKIGKGGQTTGINAEALGKINMQRFGGLTPQLLEQMTGITGASGQDLKRFVEAFNTGMGDFQKVMKGADEVNSQFQTATDNMASGFDKFKERTKNAGRELGEALSSAAKDLLNGNLPGALSHGAEAAESAHKNKGTMVAALGLTALAGSLMGKGAQGVLSKIPGAGLAGGLAMGEAAKAAGVQPVYVVNASEIAEKNSAASKAAEAVAAGGGLLGKAGGLIKGLVGIGAAFEVGSAIGEAFNEIPAVKKAGSAVTDMIFDSLNPSDEDIMTQEQMKKANPQALNDSFTIGGMDLSPDALKKAVADGFVEGHNRVNKEKPVTYSSPTAAKFSPGRH